MILISAIQWDRAKIVRFGWTLDERLVLLNEEGVYRIYDLQGEHQQHSLGPEAAELGVLDARIHDNGLVAMTNNFTLLEVKDWEGGRSLTLASTGKPSLIRMQYRSNFFPLAFQGLSEPPHAWAIIPPDLNISRHVEVLLSVEATIYTVDNLESVDQRINKGPFTHISPSPNGKLLALVTFSGMLWVVSLDFQRSMVEFDTNNVVGAEGSVKQVEWCGNDAILLTWDGLAVLVGPPGDTLQYVASFQYLDSTHVLAIQILLHWSSLRRN